MIYTLANEVYRANVAGEHSQHVLDLPENTSYLRLPNGLLAHTDHDEGTIGLADLSTGIIRELYRASGRA